MYQDVVLCRQAQGLFIYNCAAEEYENTYLLTAIIASFSLPLFPEELAESSITLIFSLSLAFSFTMSALLCFSVSISFSLAFAASET